MTELRLAALQTLDLDDYLSFMGYETGGDAMGPAERREVFEALPMAPRARGVLGQKLADAAWRAPIYLGAWEQAFDRLSRAVAKIVGPKADGLFACKDQVEHLAYLDAEFPWLRWRLAVMLLGNATTFKGLMYKDSFPRLNLARTSFGFYRESLDQALRSTPARRNFFLNILLKGRLQGAEATPDECRPEVYAAAKRALARCEVRYEQDDLLQFASRQSASVSFYSTSDVLSYATPAQATAFKGALRQSLRAGGVAVCRYYRYKPATPVCVGLENVSANFTALFDGDMTGVYRFEVLRKTS